MQAAAEWLARPDALIDVEKELCSRSLARFAQRAWHVLEPSTPLVWGWALDAICEHLEAVTAGELTRLVMNVPPGMMKSLLTSVIWPAWEWGPKGRPELRFMGAAYEQDLAIRDARKMRMLVESEWYQARWPIAMARDQNLKTAFENTSTGFRLARSSTSLTGQRVDRLILDDPHSVSDAESDAIRKEQLKVFREAAQNRMVNAEKSAIVVIMQRLHEEDISGWLIANAPVYETLILPMEYEPDRKCTTRIGFEDPRTEPGELLFPERFSRESLDRDRPILGEYAWAGQYQQTPTPRDGALFLPDNIGVVDTPPEEITLVARAWDLAGTQGAGAFTAGVLLGRLKNNRGYIVLDVRRDRLRPHGVKTLIKETAELDRAAWREKLRMRLPQDPGQAGVAQKVDYAEHLDGFPVEFVRPTGDKVARALPVSTQVEAGRFYMLRGPWNDAFKGELRMFPAGIYKDQTDALSDAYDVLLNNPDPVELPPVGGAGSQSRIVGAVR